MPRPEYDTSRFIHEGSETPLFTSYKTALKRFETLSERFRVSQSDEDARLFWNQHDQLNSLLEMGGKFPLGERYVTAAARQALEEQSHQPVEFLLRHRNGDWGELNEQTARANENALVYGGRLISRYSLRTEGKIWALTEADKASTTLLLPKDW